MQLTPRTPEAKETETLVAAASDAAESWSANASPSHVAGNHLDLPELIEIIQRQWRWIVGALALTLAAGVCITALQQRKYAATTQIVIYQQAQQTNDTGLATVNKIEGMATNRSIRTLIRLLQSREIMVRALASLPVQMRKTGFRNGPELQVQEPEEGDDVIAVTVKALTPQAAAALANNLAQVLIEHDVEESRKTATTALAYVGSELSHVNADLHIARKQLAEFAVAHDVVGDDEVLNQHIKYLSQLQLEADQAARMATTSRQLARALRGRISDGRGRNALAEITEAQNPFLDKVDMQINDLESQRLELRQKFVPDAPEVKKVEEELRAAREHRAQILSTRVTQQTRKIDPVYQVLGQQYLTATTDADTAQIRLGVLQREIAAKREVLSKLPSLKMQEAELKNNVNLLEATSALLSNNYQSLRVNEASQISNVRVLNRAYENPVPVSPNTRRNLVLSLVLGILLAVTMTAAREMMDTRICSQRTLEGIIQ